MPAACPLASTGGIDGATGGNLRCVDEAVARSAARRGWDAIEARRLDLSTGLFGERSGRLRRRRRYEHLWPFAGAWSALCALASVEGNGVLATRLDRQLEAVEHYRRPEDPEGGLSSAVTPPLGPGGERYFDDNAWIGLALLRHARLGAAPVATAKAVELAAWCATGWLGDDHVARPGGIRWKEGLAPGSRNTCANAPLAELAAALYLEGGDGAHLELAQRVYAWTRSALRTVRGLYGDRIAPDGTVTSSVLSYNQGTMIGAGVLLQRATGEDRYLDDAVGTARASLARYGDGAALRREPPGFVAIYLRNLLFLDAVVPDPSSRQLAVAYAEALVRARGGDGLVADAGGDGSALLSSAALVEVCSLLAGAPPLP